LDAFALDHQRQFAGQAAEFPRLTGFCLLIRRDALRKIGALDERFGTGFFEGDDLCLRARKAGLRLRIAPDVFIHNEGGRTFRSLGLNAPALLEQNFELFRQKWGDEHAAPYRRPAVAAPMKSSFAEKFGAKVFDFPWIDSFAAARNESLRHATGDWVFRLADSFGNRCPHAWPSWSMAA